MKKQPTDSTLRNVKASNSRDAKLLMMIKDLQKQITDLGVEMSRLSANIKVRKKKIK